MRTIFSLLLVLALSAGIFIQNGSAQVPILHYSFENPAYRTIFVNGAEQSINSVSSSLLARGNSSGSGDAIIYSTTGSGTANGGPNDGEAIAGYGWSTSTIQAAARGISYFQFTINTTGLTGISIQANVGSSTGGPRRVGFSYSTDGGTTWTDALVWTGLTVGYWYNLTQTGTLNSNIENKSSVICRFYGYYASSAASYFIADNFLVYATGTTGTITKTLLNEVAVVDSWLSNTTTINAAFIRTNFAINSGAYINLGSFIPINGKFLVNNGGTLNAGTTRSLQGSGTFTLNSGANLVIGSPDGITSSGNYGNIITATRNFNTGANYVYEQSLALMNLKNDNEINASNNLQQEYKKIDNKLLNENKIINISSDFQDGKTNKSLATKQIENIQISKGVILDNINASAQVTGNGLPSNVNNLTINNLAGVTQNSTLVSSVFTPLYSQGFNGSPAGWTTAIVTNTGIWGDPAITYVSTSSYPTGFYPTEGSQMGLFNSYTCDEGDQIRLYQTTPISTVGKTGTTVKFDWTTNNNSSGDYVTIQYSTNGTTWNSVSDYVRFGGTSQWNTYYCSLPSGADNQATLYIGLLFTSGWGDDCHFDNLSVGSLVRTLAPQLTVNGGLNLQSGNLTIGSNTLILNGTVSGSSALVGGIASNLTVNGSGANLTLPSITNGLQNLTINRANGVTLNNYLTVSGTLTMTSGNISTGANNLTIGSSGIISGGSASSYVVTNGTGQLKRTVNNNNTDVLFPVGKSAYNPLKIQLNPASTTNIFGVKVSDAIANPGYDPTKAVNRQWDITKATSDASNATIQFQFNAGEGLTDYGTGEIAHWNSSSSSYDPISAIISGTGNGPYTITNIALITTFSPFIVGNAGVNPVELASFSANVISRDVKLNWTTASEINNAGFEILRSAQNDNWIKVGYVNGNGTKTTPTNYTFEEKKLNTGKYNYRLKQIDYNGNFEYHNLAGIVEIGVPNKFDISQNYPNPFNPTAKIDFDLPSDSKVSIKLYDISGKELLTLVNEQKSAGYYTIQMNGNNLSSGMYFYRIIAEGSGQKFVMTKKAMLIK